MKIKLGVEERREMEYAKYKEGKNEIFKCNRK